MPEIVNDVHSALNPTPVSCVLRPTTVAELQRIVATAGARGERLAVSGSRHAMGGQQFLTNATLLDLRSLDAGFELDSSRGLLSAPAGAQWTAIIAAIRASDAPGIPAWSIRQKQTGADTLTLGGAVASNAHGRGLAMGPIVDDIESLELILPTGDLVSCSRQQHGELFSLVVGGYGLFGIVTRVVLRLDPRRALVRHVDVLDLDDAAHAVYRRARDGALYGDFQYAIDPRDDSFLRRGVFACYCPVSPDDPDPDEQSRADLNRSAWLDLLALAHRDKSRAFALYAQHYLATHGRTYWSDLMQLSTYIPSYADFLASTRPTGGPKESLMITELYVPPKETLAFMEAARLVLRRTSVEDIYGTIRAVRADRSTFLPWAPEDRACVIFNLRTAHTPEGLAATQAAARGLIECAADLGGSFYLTYHRWATREQVLRCYPRFPELLAKKRELDPRGVIGSDWLDHWQRVLGRSG